MNLSDKIAYHNVDYIEKTNIGDRLYRYSYETMQHMNDSAKNAAGYACGCELRFVTQAAQVCITLFSNGNYGSVLVYHGDNMCSEYRVTKVGYHIIRIDAPKCCIDQMHYKQRRFSPNVWRVYINGFECSVCDINTQGNEIRKPFKDELPAKTVLSYGSSISHGMSTLVHTCSYPQTFSRMIGADCLIKGVSGACQAEPEIAESFAKRNDWDIALLEIGINMLGNDKFSPNIFKERFEYFTKTLYNTGKKLILLTVFPTVAFYEKNEQTPKLEAYNRIIRETGMKFPKERCAVIEGSAVLTDPSYLSADCLHPSTEGHTMMGANLYKEFMNTSINSF